MQEKNLRVILKKKTYHLPPRLSDAPHVTHRCPLKSVRQHFTHAQQRDTR